MKNNNGLKMHLLRNVSIATLIRKQWKTRDIKINILLTDRGQVTQSPRKFKPS